MALILGLDLSTQKTGYGVVEMNAGQPPRFVDCGLIEHQHKPAKMGARYEALCTLELEVGNVAEWHEVTSVVAELPAGTGFKGGFAMGQFHGVARLAVEARQSVVWHEVWPSEVKRLVAGRGNASKADVARAVERALDVPLDGRSDDETDALAVALCAEVEG